MNPSLISVWKEQGWHSWEFKMQSNLNSSNITGSFTLLWLIRTSFRVPMKFFSQFKMQIFREIFLFYNEIVCRGDSNECTQHTIIV